MKRFIGSLTMVVVSAGGCISINPQKNFEEPKNAAIGKRIDQTVYVRNPTWIRKLDEHRTEYGYRIDTCAYAFEVSAASTIIANWRYISEPSSCWNRLTPLLRGP
jgi:hypothetical protein